MPVVHLRATNPELFDQQWLGTGRSYGLGYHAAFAASGVAGVPGVVGQVVEAALLAEKLTSGVRAGAQLASLWQDGAYGTRTLKDTVVTGTRSLDTVLWAFTTLPERVLTAAAKLVGPSSLLHELEYDNLRAFVDASWNPTDRGWFDRAGALTMGDGINARLNDWWVAMVQAATSGASPGVDPYREMTWTGYRAAM